VATFFFYHVEPLDLLAAEANLDIRVEEAIIARLASGDLSLFEDAIKNESIATHQVVSKFILY